MGHEMRSGLPGAWEESKPADNFRWWVQAIAYTIAGVIGIVVFSVLLALACAWVTTLAEPAFPKPRRDHPKIIVVDGVEYAPVKEEP